MLFHCGPVGIEPKAGRRRSQVFRYEQMLADNPETRFILGHAGALQYSEGIELLKRYPNAWCDVSCLSLPALRQVLDEVPTEKIMFGTDWPFYHQSLTLAKVLIATEGNDAARRAVLGGNARHLFGSELD